MAVLPHGWLVRVTPKKLGLEPWTAPAVAIALDGTYPDPVVVMAIDARGKPWQLGDDDRYDREVVLIVDEDDENGRTYGFT